MSECTGCHKVNYCSTFCQRKVLRAAPPPDPTPDGDTPRPDPPRPDPQTPP